MGVGDWFDLGQACPCFFVLFTVICVFAQPGDLGCGVLVGGVSSDLLLIARSE